MAIQPFQMVSKSIDAYPLSQFVNNLSLSGTTAEDTNVPATAKYVVITASVMVWLKRATTAVAAADVTDGSACIMIPASVPMLFKINGETVLSVVAASGGLVNFQWYS